MKRLIVLVVMVFISAFAWTDEEDVFWGELSMLIEGASGSRIISMVPAGLKPANSAAYASWVELGAVWRSDHPETVQLVLESVSSASGEHRRTVFSGIDIVMGGRVRKLIVTGNTEYFDQIHNDRSQSTHTISRAIVNIDMELFLRLLSSKNSMLFIQHQQGTEKVNFSYALDDHGVPFALEALTRFANQVKAQL